MFGDIGQDLYILWQGCPWQENGFSRTIVSTIRVSSMIFGLVYGSLFGLEKHQL